jgi:hypothetical protein
MRAVLREVERDHHDNPRNTHRDSTVLLTALWAALWAALHGGTIDWATKPKHWPGDLRPRAGLPSQSCMSRRLRIPCGTDADPAANARDCHDNVFDLLERWQAALRRQLPDSDVKLIDGRGLVIGGCSKDRDAGFGYTAGTKAKGYKLHWTVDHLSGAVDGWLVAPMNYPEPEAARRLIATTCRLTRGTCSATTTTTVTTCTSRRGSTAARSGRRRPGAAPRGWATVTTATGGWPCSRGCVPTRGGARSRRRGSRSSRSTAASAAPRSA